VKGIKPDRSPIWLDIETGGIDPSKSSILSIASGQSGKLHTSYMRPVANSFLSRFSEENIVPQLVNKSLISEKQSIESLISTLHRNPSSPLAGYNIRGFDIGFIQRRARQYGLEKSFTQVLKNREIIDPIYHVKDIVASAVSHHADIGTFNKSLGGLSWPEAVSKWGKLPFSERPTEYNLLAQVKGYLHSGSSSAMFKGWKLTDINSLLDEASGPVKFTGKAHEAATDLLMSERVMQSVRTGALSNALENPAIAEKWLSIVKGRGYHEISGSAGRLLSQANIDQLGLNTSITHRVASTVKKHPKLAIGAGLLTAAALAFSGKDDNYNSIEGLPHGGFAQSGRLQLTEFGSGWRGRTLDPRITEFREDIWSDSEKRKEVLAKIKEEERAAQEDLGAFNKDEVSITDTLLKGAGSNPTLKVDISNFNISAEDADTLILKRKGLFNFFDNPIQVRLAGIDAPETSGHSNDPLGFIRFAQNQPMGEEATSRLQEIIDSSNNLSLYITGEKTYGRYLGAVQADNQSIAQTLVSEGMVAALPFGKVEGDILNRETLRKAQEQAELEERGMWKLKRYKAIAAANEQLDTPLTYNTLTRLDKLASGDALASYATLLESMGEETGKLTVAQASEAASAGRSIANYFRARMSGRDDNHNVIQGLGHRGWAGANRSKNTEFGSGYQTALKKFLNSKHGLTYLQAGIEQIVNVAMWKLFAPEDKNSFGSTLNDLGLYLGFVGTGAQLGYHHAPASVKQKIQGALFSGFGRSYNTVEGMSHAGIASTIRSIKTEFASPWKGIIGIGKKLAEAINHRGAFQFDIKDTRKFSLAMRGRKEFSKSNPDNVRKELASFLLSTRKAKQAGRESIVGIERNFDWKAVGMDLRTAIYHERTHEQVSKSGLRQFMLEKLEYKQGYQATSRSNALIQQQLLNRGESLESAQQLAYDAVIGNLDTARKADILLPGLFKATSTDLAVQGYKRGREEETFVRALEQLRSGSNKKSVKIGARGYVYSPEELRYAEQQAEIWGIKISKRRQGKFPRVASSRSDHNVIPGMDERGFAASIRKFFGFGSPWLGLSKRARPIMSGKDDAHNIIEGLGHSGIGGRLRKLFTSFGSGWRGLIKIPERIVESRFNSAAGFVADINAFRDMYSESSKALKLLHGKDWWKTEAGKEIRKFGSDILDAKKAGFTHAAGINTRVIRKMAETEGKDFGSLLKHTIAHERIHLGLRLQQRSISANIDVPQQFLRHMRASASYSKQSVSMHNEEFIANISAVSKYPERAQFDTRVRDALLGASTKQITEGLNISAKIEKTLKADRYIRMQRFKAAKKSKFDGMNHKGIASSLRKKITDFGSSWTKRFVQQLSRGEVPKGFERFLSGNYLKKAPLIEDLERALSSKTKEDISSLIQSIRQSEKPSSSSLNLRERLQQRKTFQNLPSPEGDPEEYIDLYHGTTRGSAESTLLRGPTESIKEQQNITGTYFHSEKNIENVEGYARRASKYFPHEETQAFSTEGEAFIHTRIQKKFVRLNPDASQSETFADEHIVPNFFWSKGTHRVINKQELGELQKSASKTVWEAGKNGGRRSRT
jgi:endonuclease YncB( thermonuclease family)